MKKHGLAALVVLALGSVMILDQVHAESVSPVAPASHEVQDPLQESAPAVAPAAAGQETSQETSASQNQESSAKEASSDSLQADESEPATLPAVPALDLAPKANSQPPVKPVDQGISTSFYQFTESAGRGTFLAHISYGDYDEAGYRKVAPKSQISAQLQSATGQGHVPLEVKATQNPRLFELSFDSKALATDMAYRVMIKVADNQEQLWYGDRQYKQAVAGLELNAQGARVSLRKAAPVQKGISTSFYEFSATDTVGTILAHIAYGTYDATGYREVAPQAVIKARLEATKGQHQVGLRVRASQNPRLFNLEFDRTALKADQTYRVLISVDNKEEALWAGDNSYKQESGDLTAMVAKQRVLVKKSAPAKPVDKGISTSFYDFSVVDGVAKILAHLSYGTYDATGYREAAPAKEVSAQVLSQDGRHKVNVQVKATQNPRLFELLFDASQIRKGQIYQVVGGVGNASEVIWHGDRSLSQQGGKLLLTAPGGRLQLQYQERLVNHEVKVRGIGTTIQVLDANGKRQTVPVKDYFGQRFGVASLSGSKNAEVALIRNNKVFAYAKRSDLVEVPMGKRTVYIDAGHGGAETGAVAFGRAEKDMNLDITRPLADRLRRLGYEVYESRVDDKEIPLGQRELEPNRLMPDIFVSVHHNAMPAALSGKVQGILSLFHDHSIEEEGFMSMPYHPESKITEGKRLAQLLQREMIKMTGARDQGARPQNLHVTRKTDMPAVLVELGFMDNAEEFKKLNQAAYQEKLIKGLVQGIQAYFGKA